MKPNSPIQPTSHPSILPNPLVDHTPPTPTHPTILTNATSSPVDSTRDSSQAGPSTSTSYATAVNPVDDRDDHQHRYTDPSFVKLNGHENANRIHNGLPNGKGQPYTNGLDYDWDVAFEREERERVEARVKKDLEGWRGGHGPPRSNYCPTAMPPNSYYHTPITGTIGQDLPKEVLRIERDWSDGEVCQFETVFPMELDRRVTPVQFTTFIETLNTHLLQAYSTRGAVLDNLIAIATWWTSLWWRTSHFEKELLNIERIIQTANTETFNPVGLNVLSPRDVALQFLEIEYY